METENKNINHYYDKLSNLLIQLFLNHRWLRQIILFVIILITVTISWWILAVLSMSYEDGVKTYAISKWSYMIFKYGIAYSYNFYKSIEVECFITLTILTTSFTIYILINLVLLLRKIWKRKTK